MKVPVTRRGPGEQIPPR